MKNEMSMNEMLSQLDGLYQSDPGEFERLSRLLIDRAIESFPLAHRQRAYGLQFQLEHKLRKFRDPVARMNKMVEIFWDQVMLFQQVLEDPEGYLQEKANNQKEGKVIPFSPGGRKSLH